MVSTDRGHGFEHALNQALALTSAAAQAPMLFVETEATQTRWGADDPGARLPVVKSSVLVPDARSDGQFSNHRVINALDVRCLAGVPLQASPRHPVMGTLWALSKAPHAFGSSTLHCLERAGAVIGGLLSPQMQASELERLVTALPTPAVAVFGERVILNASTCALTGYAGDEITTLSKWFEALYGADAAMARELYEADRASGFLDPRTSSLVRRDGWERLVQIHATVVGVGELWMLSDITERVASQERFRLLFEQSSTPHLLLNATGLIDCNPAAVSLLGYRSKSDLLRRHLKDFSPEYQPDGQRSADKAAKMETLAIELGSHRFDWMHQTSSGTAIPVEVTLTLQTLGAQNVFLVEWHDLTERFRYEAGLREARDSAMQYARAKSDFLAVMSHEIRTPMNGVLGMTRLLLETPLSTQQHEYVDTLRACSEGLLTLLNDILDFSRLEAGKVTLESIPVSLRDLVDEALSVVAEAAENKGLSLVVLENETAPQRVLTDPTRLRQVVLNLLSNAVKFTEHGGVEVVLSASPGQTSNIKVLTLAVKDSGIGIAPEALSRLFDSFSQEDSSTTRRFGGSGLGLAICKRLVDLMGGVIDVATGSHGSTFSVTLQLPEVEAPAPSLPLAKRSVLVVAPSSAERRGLEQVLRFAGATVETADSDLQAFERSERHDLVLVDDTPQIAHARTLAAKLVAPHRRVGLITSNRTSPVDFPPGCFRLGRPVRRRHLLEAMTRALTVPVLHPPKQNTAEPAPFVGLRVLVAEDNAINQRVIRGLLAKLGCHVHIAENGQLALDAMANNRWDIVFMDCQMPKVDGFEATRQARHTFGEQLPIIALTAGTMEGDRERCLASGMNDFLAKPVRPEDLRRMIAAYATAPRPVASTG